MRKIFILLAILAIVGCTEKTAEQKNGNMEAEAKASVKEAHENYNSAINTNNYDAILEMLTDDVVFLAAGFPPFEGKENVGPWIKGYLEAYKTRWDKTMHEFEVFGDYAFERYSYHSVDSSLEDGSIIEDTGWGLVIFHRDADGKWRVTQDAWGPDHPAEQ